MSSGEGVDADGQCIEPPALRSMVIAAGAVRWIEQRRAGGTAGRVWSVLWIAGTRLVGGDGARGGPWCWC